MEVSSDYKIVRLADLLECFESAVKGRSERSAMTYRKALDSLSLFLRSKEVGGVACGVRANGQQGDGVACGGRARCIAPLQGDDALRQGDEEACGVRAAGQQGDEEACGVRARCIAPLQADDAPVHGDDAPVQGDDATGKVEGVVAVDGGWWVGVLEEWIVWLWVRGVSWRTARLYLDVAGVLSREGMRGGLLGGDVARGVAGLKVRLRDVVGQWGWDEGVNEERWNGFLRLSRGREVSAWRAQQGYGALLDMVLVSLVSGCRVGLVDLVKLRRADMGEVMKWDVDGTMGRIFKRHVVATRRYAFGVNQWRWTRCQLLEWVARVGNLLRWVGVDRWFSGLDSMSGGPDDCLRSFWGYGALLYGASGREVLALLGGVVPTGLRVLKIFKEVEIKKEEAEVVWARSILLGKGKGDVASEKDADYVANRVRARYILFGKRRKSEVACVVRPCGQQGDDNVACGVRALGQQGDEGACGGRAPGQHSDVVACGVRAAGQQGDEGACGMRALGQQGDGVACGVRARCIAPLQGDGAPIQGDDTPLQGDDANLQGDDTPIQRDDTPQNGEACGVRARYIAPLQGDDTPLQGNDAVLQGVGANLQGDGAPLQGEDVMGERGEEIRRGVARLLVSDRRRWWVLRLRRSVGLEDVVRRLDSEDVAAPEWFYPYEEIARRTGRRLVWQRKPVIRDVVFFRCRESEIRPLMRAIGDLGWCYSRGGRSGRGGYAWVPDGEFARFQLLIGQFTPDYVVGPIGGLELHPGDRVVFQSGIMEGRSVDLTDVEVRSGDVYRLYFIDGQGIEWKIDAPRRGVERV